MNSLKRLATVYSDSEEEENSSEPSKSPKDKRKGVKRNRNDDHCWDCLEKARMKLEVPTGILKMFQQSEVSSDSQGSSDHDGRIRGFEHFPGNWATHVFVPFRLPDSFSEFVVSLKDVWPEEASELHTCDFNDFHVSISRTVPIRHHWIKPLVEFLERGFSGKRRFICDFPTIGVYVNDEKTRTFLALNVDLGVSQLNNLVAVVNEAFQEFGLPKYYEKPSFHASFLWALGDMSDYLPPSTVTKMQDILDSYVEDNSPLVFTTEEIQCRTGNKVFHFPLTDN